MSGQRRPSQTRSQPIERRNKAVIPVSAGALAVVGSDGLANLLRGLSGKCLPDKPALRHPKATNTGGKYRGILWYYLGTIMEVSRYYLGTI